MEPSKEKAQFCVYASSQLIDPSLDEANYQEWYERVHIPDLLQTGCVKSAALYRCINHVLSLKSHGEQRSTRTRRWLAIYYCYSLDFMLPENISKNMRPHELLGKDGDKCKNSGQVATWEVRQYSILENRTSEG